MTTQEAEPSAVAAVAAAPRARTARLADRWHRFWTKTRPDWLTEEMLTGARWGLVCVWLLLFVLKCATTGVPFDREGLLLWIATGAAAASLGKRAIATVVLDFLPLALVLVAYDYLRGVSDTLGMPTWWQPQIAVDKFLAGGTEPTLWLQEHLKYPSVQWYDIVVCLCYYSFFFLPYVTAGVLWMRGRRDFYRWSLRFVSLSFLGFAFFALIPAAPPWAAALCRPREVAGHPNFPACMQFWPHTVPGNMLGRWTGGQPHAHPFVERIAARGFSDLHLSVAHDLWTKGFSIADPVAAVPSLHLGGTMLFVLFMWPRVRRWWRPILVAYPLVMTFTLVYSGEHYVADCLAGALLAVLVQAAGNRIERRRERKRSPDTLETSPQPA